MIAGIPGVTLFSPNELDLAAALRSSGVLGVVPERGAGGMLEVSVGSARIRLSRMKRDRGGPFSRCLLGLSNVIRRRDATAARDAIELLSHTASVVGVAFDPELAEDDPRGLFVESLARDSGSLLLDGNTLFRPDGTVIADVRAR